MTTVTKRVHKGQEKFLIHAVIWKVLKTDSLYSFTVLIQFSWFRIQQKPADNFKTCSQSCNIIKLVTKNSCFQFSQITIWIGYIYDI